MAVDDKPGAGVDRTLIWSQFSLPILERVGRMVRSTQNANDFFGKVWKKPPAIFKPFEALGTLVRHGVEFIVVDGLAGAVWGSPVCTMDTAVCIANADANRAALAHALVDLGAATPDIPASATWRAAFHTRTGIIECCAVADYDGIRARASELEIAAGLRVFVCSLDDQMSMKRAVGTIKDRIELETLAAVKEEREKLG